MYCEWIKSNAVIPEIDIKKYIALQIKDGTYIAIYTDKVECGNMVNKILNPDITDTGHLLELRIFNINAEFRAYRSVMGTEFKCRTADDMHFKSTLDEIGFDTKFKNRTYDEPHYLDIDTTKTTSSGGRTYFTATGGGKYVLPVDQGIRGIKLRSYINYSPETGNLQIADWRAVEFLPEVK